jgi:hypothetical protein
VLSNGLPWLAAAGRQIVAVGSQRPLLLRGVNRSGLEYAEPDARDLRNPRPGLMPVFVSEWGGGTQHVGWGETLVRYLRRLGIGWTAWSWSDRPRLVLDAQAQRYEPTDFGRVVRRCLTGVA